MRRSASSSSSAPRRAIDEISSSALLSTMRVAFSVAAAAHAAGLLSRIRAMCRVTWLIDSPIEWRMLQVAACAGVCGEPSDRGQDEHNCPQPRNAYVEQWRVMTRRFGSKARGQGPCSGAYAPQIDGVIKGKARA
eukprot:scaffold289139_cov33-Tisochrysis_lutea.AAC.2